MNAPNGSEGTRDATLGASPVPERQATASVDRKLKRPAISWTGLFGHFVLSLRTGLIQPCLMRILWKWRSKFGVVRNKIIPLGINDVETRASRAAIHFNTVGDSVVKCHNLACLRASAHFAPHTVCFFNSGSLLVALMKGVCP